MDFVLMDQWTHCRQVKPSHVRRPAQHTHIITTSPSKTAKPVHVHPPSLPQTYTVHQPKPPNTKTTPTLFAAPPVPAPRSQSPTCQTSKTHPSTSHPFAPSVYTIPRAIPTVPKPNIPPRTKPHAVPSLHLASPHLTSLLYTTPPL